MQSKIQILDYVKFLSIREIKLQVSEKIMYKIIQDLSVRETKHLYLERLNYKY